MPTAQIAVPDADRRAAVRSLLFTVLRLTAGDRLVVAMDPAYRTQAAWLAATARRDGVATRLVGSAGWGAARLGARVRDALGALGSPDAGTVLFLGGDPLDPAALALPGGVTALQLPGGEPESLADAVRDRAPLLAALSAATAAAGALLVATGGAERLRIACGPVRQDPQTPAAGRLRIAPLGRVEVRPHAADGVFVADVALGVNRTTRLGTTLAHRPVRLTVRDRRVTAVECADPVLDGFLRRAVEVHRAGLVRAVACRPVGPDPAAAVPGEPAATPAALRRLPYVSLRLAVDPADAYSTASADLRIDLTARAAWDPAAPVEKGAGG